MTVKPIIFSAPMVRALLDGRKTQTRRVLKPPYGTMEWLGGQNWRPICTKFFPGDRLYVREAFTMSPAVRHPDRVKNVIYRADVPVTEPPARDVLTMDRLLWSWAHELKWKPSIHMPRWASRLTLTVTNVRVQRLQQITAEECTAEGVPFETDALAPYEWSVSRFADLWNSLHGPDAWGANPWVVALTFTVHRENIDRVEASK